MNCITYARVSTERQAEKELSIPAQLSAMREYAQRQGWTVLEEYTEPGASARTAERPVLKRMLARCKAEPKIDVVLVHKVDRLARNVYDHATIRYLLKQQGVRIASVVENMDDSVTGQLVENIMASLAQWYSGNLSEEVKKGMNAKIARGEWPHKPPLGYHFDKGPDGRSKVEPHPASGPLMREAFALYASGFYSIKQLARELAPKGLTTRLGEPLGQGHFNVLLRNPFYTGRLKWKGAILPGAHEALVPIELFERVQRQLSARALRGSVKYGSLEFWLKGIAFCGACGTRMTADRHRGHAYYRCLANARDRKQCSAPYSNAERVQEKLRAVYKAIFLTADAKQQLLEMAESRLRKSASAGNRTRQSLVTSRTKLLERQLEAAETYTSGDMPKHTYLALMERSSCELSVLEGQLRTLAADPEAAIAAVRARVAEASSLWDFHAALPAADRPRLAYAAFDGIDLLAGDVADARLRPAFATLVGHAAAPNEARAPVAQLAECLTALVGNSTQFQAP